MFQGAGDSELKKDFHEYQRYANQDWTVVSRSKNRKSYVDAIQEPHFLNSRQNVIRAQSQPRSMFERLDSVHPSVSSVLSAGFQNSGPSVARSQHVVNGEAQAHPRDFCVRCLLHVSMATAGPIALRKFIVGPATDGATLRLAVGLGGGGLQAACSPPNS